MRELNESERENLVELGLALEAEDYAVLDNEDGFIVREGRQVGWEIDGILEAYEMSSIEKAKKQFAIIVKEHGSI